VGRSVPSASPTLVRPNTRHVQDQQAVTSAFVELILLISRPDRLSGKGSGPSSHRHSYRKRLLICVDDGGLFRCQSGHVRLDTAGRSPDMIPRGQ
jgi:hypothetical protein